MNKSIYGILFLVLATAGSLAWWQSGKKDSTANLDSTLIVGTNEFPPFIYKDGDDLVGFDIDLMNAVAQKMNKKIEWRHMAFDALIPGIQLGQLHVVAAGMTPTPERAQRVLFTKPYLQGDTLALVIPSALASSITSLADLKGKTAVVNEGYTADYYMSKQEGVTLLRLETPLEAFMALQAGHAQAFVAATRTLPPFLEKFGPNSFKIIPLLDTEESAAMMISKKHPDLLEPIQKALDELENEGTLLALKKKWKLA